MDRLRSIVIGVDFTPASAAAVRQGIRIAKWNRSRLHAVHIVDSLVLAAVQDAAIAFKGDIRSDLVEDARAGWKGFIADVPESEALELTVEVGSPRAGLLKAVQDLHADLLVLGVTGASGGAGVGTLASACVRKAKAPVLLVQHAHTGQFKSVVACVDFSETSRVALERAIRTAAQDSAALHVVHVFYGPWNRPHYWEPAWPVKSEVRTEYTAGVEKKLKEFCEPLRHELEYLKAQMHVIDHPGSHGVAIGEFVRRQGADLVVLGTRGRTNLRDMIIGSTAERVVRDVPCSILAVRPPEENGAAGK
jgi:universal stress protein E